MMPINKCKLIILSITLIIVLGASAVHAQQNTDNVLAEAQQWLAEGEYHKAYNAFRFYAEKKQNHLAQFTLALFYQQGWDVEQNEAVACQWYEKAAKGDIPAANHFFAQCLQDGIHQSTDYAAAIHWYQQAANLGHTISLCAIADLYMQGSGVVKDPQKALAYCQQAASAGSLPAQLKMGRFYLSGEESIRDPYLAAVWYGYAAEKNSLEAYYQLGVINLNVLNDRSQALYWFEMAASQGYLPAYYQTARLYFNAPLSEETGMPAAENLAKSYLWLSAAKQQSKQDDERQGTLSMLEKVEQVIPESWKDDLDEKVSQHLSEFH